MSKDGFFLTSYGMLHDRWIFLGSILFLVLFIASCGGLFELQEWLKCNQLASMNPVFNFDYTFLNGCMVQTQESNAWVSATKLLELIN